MFVHTSVSLAKLSCGMAGIVSYSVFRIKYQSNKHLRTYFTPGIVDMRDMVVNKAKTLLAIKWEETSQINEHINKQENSRVKSALQSK